MIRDLIAWGLSHDPYAPLIVIILPAFLIAVAALGSIL